MRNKIYQILTGSVKFFKSRSMFFLYLLLLGLTTNYADEKTKKSKLLELFKLQGLTELVEQQRTANLDQALVYGNNALAEFKKHVPESDEKALDEIQDALKAFVESVKPTWTTEEAMNTWAEYYGATITESELDQIIKYYKSPIGQKDIMATKLATPQWSAFFGEKNKKVWDKAFNQYIKSVREIMDRSMKKNAPPPTKHG